MYNRKYQKCPVCDGTGLVSRPPGVAGDAETWISSSTGPWPCQTCGGSGLILEPPNIEEVPNPNVEPPEFEIVDVL